MIHPRRSVALLTLTAVLALGAASARADEPDYDVTRTAAIVQAAQAGGPWRTVVLGDSLVEKATLPSLCGGATLNGGISGAGLADVAEYGPKILAASHPQVVVIAIGVNDAGRDDDHDTSEFSDPYGELVDQVKATGAQVFLGTVAPVAQAGKTAAWYDPRLIRGLNRAIRKLAREKSVGLVDFYGALASPSGALPPADTVRGDGVHLTPAGYVRWFKALDAICAPPAS